MTTVLDKANLAVPTVDDVLYAIDDPAGSPGDRSVTAGNLAAAMAGWAAFTGPFAPKASPTGTGVATWPAFAASGLTGAVQATRFVGGTTLGDPSSGTFAVGDFVVDQSGQIWICTVAGSPGSWEAPGSGRELAYAEIVTSANVVGIGNGNRADVLGLSVTFTPNDRPIIIETFFRYWTMNVAAAATTIAAASNGVNTSTFAGAGVLNVASTTGFPTAGELTIVTAGTVALVTYTGIGSATTFTGCTTVSGGGVMATGGAVAVTLPPTTIAAASNGVNTNTFAGAGTLNVASTTGFPNTGELDVATGTTNARIRYTGRTAQTFTGCFTLYGGGVMATGGTVGRAGNVSTAGSVGGLGLTISESTADTVVADTQSPATTISPGGNAVQPPWAHFTIGTPSGAFTDRVLAAGVPVTYKVQAYCNTMGPLRLNAGANAAAFIIVREL